MKILTIFKIFDQFSPDTGSFQNAYIYNVIKCTESVNISLLYFMSLIIL